MRSLEQIIHDNGGDNTPMYDSHNLTGRAPKDEGVNEWENEGGYAPLASIDEEIPFSVEVV